MKNVCLLGFVQSLQLLALFHLECFQTFVAFSTSTLPFSCGLKIKRNVTLPKNSRLPMVMPHH